MSISDLQLGSSGMIWNMRGWWLAGCWLVSLWWAVGLSAWAEAAPKAISFELLRELPHDRASFTQGLIVDGEALVETSGLYGRSFITRYPAAGGGMPVRRPLPPDVFAEGLARVGDAYWVLTWQEGKVLRYGAGDLRPLPGMVYSGEGWGLAYDGQHLVMSDGSDRLTFRKVEDFAPVRQLAVRARGRPVRHLNELEYAEGLIWANIWHSPLIVAIDPASGAVVGELNLEALTRRHAALGPEAVLNGIAFDPATTTYWVTGKLWPARYELRLNWPAEPPAL